MKYTDENEKKLYEASQYGIKNLVDVMSDSLTTRAKKERLLAIITELKIRCESVI